jgi:hypothetical protein
MILLGGPHEHAADAEAVQHGSFFETLFHAAGVWAPVTIGVFVVATAINIGFLAQMMNKRVNGNALGMQLKKLIAAGNAERAVKLCHAAEKAFAPQIALIGLNARMRNADHYTPMLEARAGILAVLNRGIAISLAFGAAALVESAVMFAEALSKGFPTNELGAIAFLPTMLGVVLAMNVMQWSAAKRDIEAVIDAVR